MRHPTTRAGGLDDFGAVGTSLRTWIALPRYTNLRRQCISKDERASAYASLPRTVADYNDEHATQHARTLARSKLRSNRHRDYCEHVQRQHVINEDGQINQDCNPNDTTSSTSRKCNTKAVGGVTSSNLTWRPSPNRRVRSSCAARSVTAEVLSGAGCCWRYAAPSPPITGAGHIGKTLGSICLATCWITGVLLSNAYPSVPRPMRPRAVPDSLLHTRHVTVQQPRRVCPAERMSWVHQAEIETAVHRASLSQPVRRSVDRGRPIIFAQGSDTAIRRIAPRSPHTAAQDCASVAVEHLQVTRPVGAAMDGRASFCTRCRRSSGCSCREGRCPASGSASRPPCNSSWNPRAAPHATGDTHCAGMRPMATSMQELTWHIYAISHPANCSSESTLASKPQLRVADAVNAERPHAR